MKIIQIGEGREVQLLDRPIPQPGPGEALVKIEAVTTCPQWDLHLRHNSPMFEGHRFHYPYAIGQPGHEASGVAAKLGDGVKSLNVGDRVSVWRDGGYGCYAQYAVVPERDIIRIPGSVSFVGAAPIELAMCVGVTFLMLREMDALRGKRVAVMGLGPAGLVALQMARAEGASQVIGFDLSPERMALALKIGADDAINTREASPARFPSRPTLPSLDTSIDCVGAKGTIEWLMDRTIDTVAVFGVLREEVAFASRHWAGLRLCGYRPHCREAAEYAVDLIERGLLDLEPLVTHRMRLEDYAEAVDLLEQQKAIKVCFEPWRE
ncbi:MAG: zinc-binding dehydrogenase [Capsulimonadaceae bacterium]|nr:zinc-binding dehydrogenase [Capsulimonadaceae bacterium]